MERSKQIWMIGFFILMGMLLVEGAYCGITDQQIKAASGAFMNTMKDWMPLIIGGGLLGGGVCVLMGNYKMGLTAIGGTAFMYASKAFIGDGQGALIENATQILQAIS